jgi:ribosomal protein S28E/S33
MIHWQTGRVIERIAERSGMQEVRVELADGQVERALHDTSVQRPLREGDLVLLNTTAVRLGLGSGGYHFVHAILPEGAEASRPPAANRSGRRWRIGLEGHMMKLKYTSLQRAVLAAEEPASTHHEIFHRHQSIDGAPVLIGELHSMLPIAAAWLHRRRHDLRIAYVMSDGGALPISFSRHAAALRQLNWLCGTVTYGQAYGGDLETMNKYTALIAARHILHADVIIACMGPGIAGTGTPLGHTGTEAGELVNAAHMLRGIPILMARVSEVDHRPRHYGLSHHLLNNLRYVAACPAHLPLSNCLPDDLREVIRAQLQSAALPERHQIHWLARPAAKELEEALSAYPVDITTMGRTFHEDPGFYLCVASAAEFALQELGRSATPPDSPGEMP